MLLAQADYSVVAKTTLVWQSARTIYRLMSTATERSTAMSQGPILATSRPVFSTPRNSAGDAEVPPANAPPPRNRAQEAWALKCRGRTSHCASKRPCVFLHLQGACLRAMI